VVGDAKTTQPALLRQRLISYSTLMSSLLTNDEIEQNLAALEGWALQDNEISRRFQFPGFPEAIRFVNAVASVAEEANHHPDIDIRWNKVSLRLSTHSEGGLTALDFTIARKINELA
jgi:4a-hydroxytetrahydrobiopterin dehydratase